MRILRNIKEINRKGVTLIELVITLSILSVVLMTIFSFNLFGVRIFNNSKVRADNQFEVRMPADFIAKRIRYADEIEILSAVPASTPVGAHEIFLDSGQLKYRKYGSAAVILGTQDVLDYSLVMERKSGTSNVIQYTIGKSDNNQYDLLTDVIVLNLGDIGIEGPQQGIGVRYYTNATDSVIPVSIISIESPPLKFVSVDAIVAMPIRVKANMSDGTTRQVSARWTPFSINTSTPGIYSSSGRVVGYAGMASYKVVVGSYTIVGIEDENITINKGQSFSMPSTVVATLSNGTDTSTQNVSVTWDSVIDSSTTGNFIAEGTVESWEYPVLLTVTVDEANIVSVSNVSRSELQGTSFLLPPTIPASYSDGSIQNVPVTWNPTILSTASPGQFTSMGTISGYGSTISYQLVVESNKLPTPTNGAILNTSNNGGNQGKVRVLGTPGAKAVFRKSNGDIIASHVIPAGGEGEFSVDTRSLHDVILQKSGWQSSDPYIFK